MNSSKTKIVESAQKLFHRNGFQNTSVDSILQSTGVTKSNLYYHFKSKEMLGLLVLEKRITEYERDFFADTLENKKLTPEQRLARYYKKVIAHYQSLDFRYGCPFGNLALELSDTNEKFRLRLSEFFDHWRRVIEQCIKDGIKQEQFRNDISPKNISQLILSHLEGAIMMSKNHRSEQSLSAGSRAMLKLIKNNTK